MKYLGILLTAATLVSCAWFTPGAPGDPCAKPLFGQAEIVKVIDADTVRVRLLENNCTGDVRILGIDAPEKGECYRAESTGWAVAYLEGRVAWVERDSTQEDFDFFGRTLGYVILKAGLMSATDRDYSIDAVMTGMAEEYDKYSVAKTPELQVAEADAKADNRGLWRCEGR